MPVCMLNPTQLMKWIYGGGKKIKGLEVRRRHECDLWNGVI